MTTIENEMIVLETLVNVYVQIVAAPIDDYVNEDRNTTLLLLLGQINESILSLQKWRQS